LKPIALRLGPLQAPGLVVYRSGVCWLCEDGALCRAGEVIAYCNVRLLIQPAPDPLPFADEGGRAQVALVARVTGRLQHAPGSSRGGFFDFLESFQIWAANTVIGEITPEPGELAPEGEPLRLISMSARRHAGGFEGGLLAGWSDRTRACRADGPGAVSTLLSLGICDLAAVLRGDHAPYMDLLDQISGPAQVAHVVDDTVVHTAQVLIDQLQRTAADRAAIASDMAKTLLSGPVTPEPNDWIFAGAFLDALMRSPMDDDYEVLARDGVRAASPATAIILSVSAESQTVFRHRRLGYFVHIHGYRLRTTGGAFQTWLRTSFELVRKTTDDIRADYETLIDLIQARRPGAHVLVCNTMSSSGDDDLQSYAGFDEPLGETLASVRDKELNLMLTDLSREKGVAVVDVDAIAVELGGQRSVPDGIHQNGEMQAEVLAEILRVLHARRVPGFEPARVR
jgi:hypothetical protein